MNLTSHVGFNLLFYLQVHLPIVVHGLHSIVPYIYDEHSFIPNCDMHIYLPTIKYSRNLALMLKNDDLICVLDMHVCIYSTCSHIITS